MKCNRQCTTVDGNHEIDCPILELADDVCCCGDSMKNHAAPIYCGHSAVSMKDYYLSKRKGE